MKKWLVRKIVGWIINLAMKKADVTQYAISAADSIDEYADKHLGETTSQQIQDAVVTWINLTVTAFTERLKKN